MRCKWIFRFPRNQFYDSALRRIGSPTRDPFPRLAHILRQRSPPPLAGVCGLRPTFWPTTNVSDASCTGTPTVVRGSWRWVSRWNVPIKVPPLLRIPSYRIGWLFFFFTFSLPNPAILPPGVDPCKKGTSIRMQMHSRQRVRYSYVFIVFICFCSCIYLFNYFYIILI